MYYVKNILVWPAVALHSSSAPWPALVTSSSAGWVSISGGTGNRIILSQQDINIVSHKSDQSIWHQCYFVSYWHVYIAWGGSDPSVSRFGETLHIYFLRDNQDGALSQYLIRKLYLDWNEMRTTWKLSGWGCGAMGIATHLRTLECEDVSPSSAPGPALVIILRLRDKHIYCWHLPTLLTSDSEGVMELRGSVGAQLASVHSAVSGARLNKKFVRCKNVNKKKIKMKCKANNWWVIRPLYSDWFTCHSIFTQMLICPWPDLTDDEVVAIFLLLQSHSLKNVIK